jgi:cell division protein FtsA
VTYMQEQTPICYYGLDIGTSTVRCVIGMINEADPTTLSILGFGSAANSGMRKGVVVHIEDVAEAVRQAVSEAERLAGIRLDYATVNINGSHVAGMNSRGVVAISSANKEISVDDRLRAEEAASIVSIPPNREIIQVFAKNYRLDGQDNIKDPVGMSGVRLEVDTHIVTASTPNLRNLKEVLASSGVGPSHFTLSGLAASEAVLTRQQKEAGALVIDIGAGTTNLAIIEDSEIQHVAVIPVGGMNITNDLAIGLKTDLDIAEKVKVGYASLLEKSKVGFARVEHNKTQHRFELEEVQMITEARVDELLDLVTKQLKIANRAQKLPGGVVIVGGTAQIPGLAEFARDKLQLAARVGRPRNLGGLSEQVDSPNYSTAVGLMYLDMLLTPIEQENDRPSGGLSKFVENIFGRFGKA